MTSLKAPDIAREWLAAQDKQLTFAVGARSALRAIPIFGLDRINVTEEWETLALQLFRTNFVTWACANYEATQSNWTAHVVEANKDMLLALAAVPDQSSRQAIFAASNAASSIVSSELERTVAARQAIQTVAPNTFASSYRTSALISDYQALLKGKDPNELLQSPLWYSNQSKALTDSWKQLEICLIYLGHDWDVWIDWYVSRVFGRPASRAALQSWLNVPLELWSTSPRILNAHLKQLLGGATQFSINVKEPEPEPGPEFNITSSGLSLKSSYPPHGQFDERTQHALHNRLQIIASALADATKNVGNAYPGLEIVTSEYRGLVSEPFDQIDVVSLWAVGAGLLANRDAFARAQDARIMTNPLEPAHFALLQQAAELHGGFILGFPEARELSERADHARLSGEAMEKVVLLARSILESIRNSGRKVEENTRKFFAAIEEGLVEPGWRITRAGYAAYVVTRNALIAIGRLLNWANSAFSTIAGGILLTGVDPGLVHTQFWIEFALKHSQEILAFSEPFPELRVWLAAQIDAAERDSSTRQ